MKIPNKREFQENSFNDLSDIDLSLQKMYCKPYYFLVIDTTFASDNP